jgi:hypothetical protein
MLENDIGLGNHNDANSIARAGAVSPENFVSYRVFLSAYWNRLLQTSTKKLGEKLSIIHV